MSPLCWLTQVSACWQKNIPNADKAAAACSHFRRASLCSIKPAGKTSGKQNQPFPNFPLLQKEGRRSSGDHPVCSLGGISCTQALPLSSQPTIPTGHILSSSALHLYCSSPSFPASWFLPAMQPQLLVLSAEGEDHLIPYPAPPTPHPPPPPTFLHLPFGEPQLQTK